MVYSSMSSIASYVMDALGGNLGDFEASHPFKNAHQMRKSHLFPFFISSPPNVPFVEESNLRGTNLMDTNSYRLPKRECRRYL
jgi:hypothetical protein